MATAAERVAEQYPFFQFLLSDPQVGPLLTRAVDPATQFSPQKFQAELMNTDWYRTRSAASREWEILVNSDPAEAQHRRFMYYAGLQNIGMQLGLSWTPEELIYMGEYGLGHGISLEDPDAKVKLRNYLVAQSPFRFEAGAVQAAAHQVRTTANEDYFTSVPDDVSWNWAVDLALGYKDQSQLGEYMVGYAASRYPWLYDELVSKGKTMKQLFSGHMQTLAEEWEVTPDQIKWDNPVMQKVIGKQDLDAGGKMRPASIYETKVYARQDDNFWKTSRAKQLESGITNYLLRTFGRRAA